MSYFDLFCDSSEDTWMAQQFSYQRTTPAIQCQICEIMLFSEGFDQAKVKTTLLLRILHCPLSLGTGQENDGIVQASQGAAVQAVPLWFWIKSSEICFDDGGIVEKVDLFRTQTVIPFCRDSKDMSEEIVLMRALRDMNLPKFVFDDVPLFLGLINDLFPGLNCPRLRSHDTHCIISQRIWNQGMNISMMKLRRISFKADIKSAAF